MQKPYQRKEVDEKKTPRERKKKGITEKLRKWWWVVIGPRTPHRQRAD
jgi:hypothetical protein